ncbi:kinesin-like protein KIF11 isoform X3 [Branchiostoma floridae x Branchiostoma belcheri]
MATKLKSASGGSNGTPRESNIQVMVRVRPLNQTEKSKGSHSIVDVKNNREVCVATKERGFGGHNTKKFSFDRNLATTKQDSAEKEYLVQQHVTTEGKLYNQASLLLETADSSLGDVEGLHKKLDRKKHIETLNKVCQHYFQKGFQASLTEMQHHVEENANAQLNTCTSLMSDLGKCLTNQTHDVNSQLTKMVDTLRQGLVDIAATQQQENWKDWAAGTKAAVSKYKVEAQKVAIRHSADTFQANMRAMEQNIKEQLTLLDSQLEGSIQSMETIKTEQRNFQVRFQEMLATEQTLLASKQRLLASQQALLASHQASMSSRAEQVEAQKVAIRHSADTFQANMRAMEQNIKEQLTLLDSQLEGSIQSMETIKTEQRNFQVRFQEMLATEQTLLASKQRLLASQQALLASHQASMSSRAEQMKTDLTSIRQIPDTLTTTVQSSFNQTALQLHQHMSDIASGATDFLQEQTTTFEQDVQLGARCEKQMVTAQDQTAVFVQERQKSVEEHEKDLLTRVETQVKVVEETQQSHGQAVEELLDSQQSSKEALLNTVSTQLAQATAHVENMKGVVMSHSDDIVTSSNQTREGLQQRGTEVADFLSNGVKADVPTGITPQRRAWAYPRILCKTDPHDELLQKFRLEERAKLMDLGENQPLPEDSEDELDEEESKHVAMSDADTESMTSQDSATSSQSEETRDCSARSCCYHSVL